MKLFEVVRWGNDRTDPVDGGRNGPDTCFLVRARSVDAAAALVDRELARAPAAGVDPWAGAVYLLGEAGGAASRAGGDERVLRGPYLEHAYVHGWECWYRETPQDPWRLPHDRA